MISLLTSCSNKSYGIPFFKPRPQHHDRRVAVRAAVVLVWMSLVPPSSAIPTGPPCFPNAGILRESLIEYLVQDCSTNSTCAIGREWGWPIGTWCTTRITSMNGMISTDRAPNPNVQAKLHAFNEDISGWDTSSVTNMEKMFWGAASFNQDISRWDLSRVIYMTDMFVDASSFNQDISRWNVSEVIDMSAMFFGASAFNQNIGSWDVSKVTDMGVMFYGATSFNQNIGAWDVSKVADMTYMFVGASKFNQDTISGWDLSSVKSMSFMFAGASAFNQNMCPWKNTLLSSSVVKTDIFKNSGCTYPFTPLLNGPFCAVATCPSIAPTETILTTSSPSTMAPITVKPSPATTTTYSVPSSTPAPTISPSEHSLVKKLSTNIDLPSKRIKGIMFTVSAKQDVVITGMDIISRKNVTSNFTIYAKSGSYYNGANSRPPIEHALQADEWQQLYSGIVIPTQSNKLVTLNDFAAEVVISAGQVQSFFVFVSNGLLYNAGDAVDAPVGVAAEDDYIVIYEGQAMRGLFHNVRARGRWGGVLRYRTSNP